MPRNTEPLKEMGEGTSSNTEGGTRESSPIYCIGHDQLNGGVATNQCNTLTASDYKQPPIINETIYDPRHSSDVIREYDDGKVVTITQRCGTGGGQVPFIIRRCASTLRSHIVNDNVSLKVEGMKARRLTPAECERLQGLPGNWTEGISDTARYRMIGNGMAQPCADFVMGAVVKALSKENENE